MITGRRFAAMTLLAVSLVACSGKGDGGATAPLASGSTLRWTGDDSEAGDFGLDVDKIRVGQVIAVGSITLCLDGGGEATVSSVRFKKAEGVAVQHFALRQVGAIQLGADRRSIVDLGFDLRDTSVTSRCGDDSEGSKRTELGLDLTPTGPGTGKGKDLLIQYRSGNRSGEAVIPMSIRLCPQKCPGN